MNSNELTQNTSAKEQELQQIIEMFKGVIDGEIIKDYWAGLNYDFEKTFSFLSNMVEEIEKQKKLESEKKEETKTQPKT